MLGILELLKEIFTANVDFWKVMLALGIFMLVNIILGSLKAMMSKGFNWDKFKRGFLKAGIVLICFLGVYIAGALNPDILTLTVNDVEVNVVTGMYLGAVAGYMAYARQLVQKFSEMILKPKPIEIDSLEGLITYDEDDDDFKV